MPLPLIAMAALGAAGVGGGVGIGMLCATKDKGGTTTLKMNTENLNKDIFDFMSTNTTQMNVSTNVVQNMNITGAKFIGCTPNFNQSSTSEIKIIQSVTNETVLQLNNKLTSKFEESITQASEEENGFLSLPSGSSNDIIQETTKKFTNIIEKNITMENINKIISESLFEQSLNIEEGTLVDPCGYTEMLKFYENLNPSEIIPINEYCTICDTDSKGNKTNCKLPDCPVSQTLQVSIIVEQVVKNINKAVNESEIISDLNTYIDQSNVTKNTGVGGAIGNAAEGIGSGFGAMFGGTSGIFIVIIAIVLVFFLLKK